MSIEVDTTDKVTIQKIMSFMAFPLAIKQTEPNHIATGLTKREWFAGMALQGILAHRPPDRPEDLAKVVVCAADAILRELEK